MFYILTYGFQISNFFLIYAVHLEDTGLKSG